MIRLAIRVQREHAELVLAELLELAPTGVEEADVAAGVVEYAVYGAPGELPELPDLRAAAGGALVDISTSELPDDWGERWKQFHRPVLIEAPTFDGPVAETPLGSGFSGEGTPGLGASTQALADRRVGGEPRPALHVRPPWEAASRRPGVCEIVIDPAQAFGTGAHATTRLCLELLLELECHPAREGPAALVPLLDVGTGSGVLAIAAAKLGFAPVLALDNEIESVHAARENALVNGVELDVRHFDLRRERLPWSEPDASGVIVANLLRPLLLDLAERLPARPRDLLASGLLVQEGDEIVEIYGARWGMRERARRHAGEWVALWLTVERD